MKKILTICLCVMLLSCLALFAGCSDSNGNDQTEWKPEEFRFMTNDDGTTCTFVGRNAVNTETKLVIPDKSPDGLKVTAIGYGAFDGDTTLTEVTIPEGVTSIGSNAFEGCTALEVVSLPETLTDIESGAFSGCTALESIDLPAALVNIGGSAFDGCTAMKEVVLPDSVETVGTNAFSNCTALESFTFSKSITDIWFDLFENCPSLSKLAVSEGNATFHSKDNCIINTAEKVLVMGCVNSTIPNDGSVTVIGTGAFEGSAITSIEIPNGVTKIESSAFHGCTELESITLPESLLVIENAAFDNCDSLTDVEIPVGVTEIGGLAFAECDHLKTIYIPSTVEKLGLTSTEMGNGQDILFNCPALVRVTFGGTKNDWNIACEYDDEEYTYNVECADGMLN